MTPEPSPPLLFELASTETVEGRTLAATSWTEPAGAAARLSATGALVFSWLSELSEPEELELSWAPTSPPPNPASNAMAADVATMTDVRRLLVPDGAEDSPGPDGAGGLVAVVVP